jgi:NitT/TauT family transport system substrate-binding protein
MSHISSNIRAISRAAAIILVVAIVVIAAAAGAFYYTMTPPAISTTSMMSETSMMSQSSMAPLSKTSVTLTLPWLAAGYNAPFYAALDQGFFKAQGLDVAISEGTGSGVAIRAVAAGTFDFGEADLPTALVAMSKGVDVVSVAAIDQNTGLSAIALQSKHKLSSPSDLSGLTWGYHAGGAGPTAFQAFLTANNIQGSSIKGNTSIGYPEEAFVMSGSVDFITEFVDYEAVNIVDKGYAVSLLPFTQYGVNEYGFGILTSSAMIRDHPDTVKAFLAGAMEGEIYTLQNPIGAINSVHGHVASTNVTLLRDQLASAFAYKLWTSSDTDANGLWWQTSVKWQAMGQYLTSLLGTTSIDYTKVFTNDFLPANRAFPTSPGTITGANVPGIGFDLTVSATGKTS